MTFSTPSMADDEPSPALRGRPSRKREGDIVQQSHPTLNTAPTPSHPPSGRVERKRGEGARGCRVRQRRSGNVLVLFAMLLFGLMALAALVIDIGIARVTQRQMQTAVDAAALEGLRNADMRDYSEQQDAAIETLRWHFNGDLSPPNSGDENTAVMLGTGVEFSGHVGEESLMAGQRMSINQESPIFGAQWIRGEETNGRFQVQLSRGGINNGADLAGIGPPLPFLFARGSLINRQMLASGISVGATGLAVAKPAVKVGTPVFDPSGNLLMFGAIDVGYDMDDWNDMDGLPIPLAMDGRKTLLGQPVVPGAATAPKDGYCAIFHEIRGTQRVIGFGFIVGGVPVEQEVVSLGNATSRLSEVWNEIDEDIRDEVLTQHLNVSNPLQVSSLAPLR